MYLLLYITNTLYVNLIMCRMYLLLYVLVLYECLAPPPLVDRSMWNGTNTTLTYHCIMGYDMVSGNKTIYCNSDNTWGSEVPVCAMCKL